jgi:hypothetical protein
MTSLVFIAGSKELANDLPPSIGRKVRQFKNSKRCRLMSSEIQFDQVRRRDGKPDPRWYFRDPCSLDPQRCEEVAMHLDGLLQNRWSQYCSHTREILDDLFIYLRDTVRFHGNAIAISGQGQEARALIDAGFSKPLAKQPRVERKQDSTICALDCPMKRKWRRGYPNSKVVIKVSGATAEYSSLRVMKGGEKRVQFTLTKDYFAIDGVPTNLSLIRLILTRRRGNRETAVEFYLETGKVILIDFSSIESARVVKLFDKLTLKSVHMVQKVSSSELFANLAFRSR